MNEDLTGYPDGFTPPERRILDYVREGVLDAEVAVRLGVPVGEVKDRLERMQNKLGVGDKAGLRAWRPLRAEPDSVAADVINAEEPEIEAPSAGRVSRRRVLAVAGAAAVAACGGVATKWALERSGRSNGPARVASGNAVGSTATTITAPAGGESAVAVSPFNRATLAFEHQTFNAGERIPWTEGLFFISLSSGEIEGWRVPVPQYSYAVHGSGRYISANPGFAGGEQFLYDRVSHETFSYSALIRLGSTSNHLLVEVSIPERNLVRLLVYDATTRLEVADFNGVRILPGPGVTALSAPSGERIVAWTRRDDGRTTLRSLDLTNSLAYQYWAPETEPDPYEPLRGYGGAIGFEATVQPGEEPRVRRYSWDGKFLEPVRLPQFESAWSRSPIGGRIVAEDVLLPTEPWTAVRIAEPRGRDTHRVRSASINYTDRLPAGSRWLADDSGFVAMVDGGKDPLTPAWERAGFAVVSADGSIVRLLPPVTPTVEGAWWESVRNAGPVPHPSRRDIVSIGRHGFIDLSRDRIVQAALRDGPAHIDPWSARPEELVFALPHGGHGGSPEPGLLTTKLEVPPFDNRMRFVVARTGDCLNLRQTPTRDAAIETCYPDGTVLDLAVTGQPTVERAVDGLWVRVRAPDGRIGWVNSAYLDWA